MLIRIFVCILAASLFFFLQIEEQNRLTSLRLLLPHMEKEIKQISEENMRLKYEIEAFESPSHLLELARTGGQLLHHPLPREVLSVQQASIPGASKETLRLAQPPATLATSASH